jgi:hypothetical protein
VFITDTGEKNNRGRARRKRSLISFLQPLWYGKPKSENGRANFNTTLFRHPGENRGPECIEKTGFQFSPG